MKLNRFFVIGAIALLLVGALGTIATRTFAQSATAPAAQSQDCAASQADDATEVASAAADTDAEDLQCGDQNEADTEEAANAPDTDDVQEGDQNGTDDSAEVSEPSGGQDADPAGTPAITAEAAQKSAEAYLNAGAAAKVELDDENGQLVYSVEIGATDVKIDAMTGAVLTTEDGED